MKATTKLGSRVISIPLAIPSAIPLAIPLVITLAVALTACGGGSSSSGSGSSASDGTVNGNYQGVWLSNSTNTGELGGTFVASGRSVTATVDRHTVSACPLSSFRGTLDDATSTLTGNFTGANSTVAWTAKRVGRRLTGPYSVTSGNCAGDTGTITLTRN